MEYRSDSALYRRHLQLYPFVRSQSRRERSSSRRHSRQSRRDLTLYRWSIDLSRSLLTSYRPLLTLYRDIVARTGRTSLDPAQCDAFSDQLSISTAAFNGRKAARDHLRAEIQLDPVTNRPPAPRSQRPHAASSTVTDHLTSPTIRVATREATVALSPARPPTSPPNSHLLRIIQRRIGP